MPFKLKLKKSRQYNVVSKSLFVISIELLDGAVVECTLCSDSTGQECLENVCQRLIINQPEFFGLRYISRNQQQRWVHLERPLKRQLDKYASTHQLYLRVMYYILSGTSLITDEVTRNHYFLQLKNDLIEGRIICDYQQAVVLAAYSRQAEYGNHDTERHTVEYLKNLLSFPKQMIDGNHRVDGCTLAETGRLEWLTAAVIEHHQALHNVPQAQAEEGYISACQVLSGYGQETFMAKDQGKQSEVMIAISLTGIMVVTKPSDTSYVYRWTDITNVINHKRTFSIECQNATDSATFILPTPEEGKYIWRMCVLQHTFYMRHQQAVTAASAQEGIESQTVTQPTFQNHGLTESQDDLDQTAMEHQGSMPGLQESTALRELEPLTPEQRACSTSCLDLSSSKSQIHQQKDIDHLRALLPSYRAAPDYETAMQQKYQQSQVGQFSHQHNHNHMLNAKPSLFGSHPDIHRSVLYPDVTRHTVSVNPAINSPEDFPYGLNMVNQNAYHGFTMDTTWQPDVNSQMHYLNVYKPPPPYPSNGLASNSTPDLAIASQALTSNRYSRGYISSHVSGSSPDLVSSRSALSRQYLGYFPNVMNCRRMAGVVPSTHDTYNNLNAMMDMPNTRVIIETSHHLPHNIQKAYDERGNIVYCVPTTQLPYQTHLMIPQNAQVPSRPGLEEPIYENVPLPWQNEHSKVTLRDRAQSLTTLREITKQAERKSSHPMVANRNVNDRNSINKNLNVDVQSYKSNLGSELKISYSNDKHYMNPQMVNATNNNANIASLDTSGRQLQNFKNELESVTNSVDNLSLAKKLSVNPNDHNNPISSQSLTGHHISVSNNNNIYDKLKHKSGSNVTSISVNSSGDDLFNMSGNTRSKNLSHIQNNSLLSGTSGANTFIANHSSFNTSEYSSLDVDSNMNMTKSNSITSKEKKRRRWGVFIGRGNKTNEVKSATLGRDKSKNSVPKVQQNVRQRWSTGLAKFQPLPPSITKETLCQLLERKMSDSQLTFAFEQIAKGRDTNVDMTTALYPENSHFNEFHSDYLPYEDNRVRLNPTAFNKHGYINASHITLTVGSSQRFYVIARVPASNTKKSHLVTSNTLSLDDNCALVWTAVWQVGTRVFALVAGLEKPPYLPEQGKTIRFGKFQIHTESTVTCEFGRTSRVRLQCGDSTVRALWHIQYTHWPDNLPVPESTDHFLAFLSEMSELRRHCIAETLPPHNGNAPVMIGCSQGAGRSGTVLTADLLLYGLDYNQELDIPRTINQLHQQRANLIQSLHQYRFLHQVLIQYLKQSRLI